MKKLYKVNDDYVVASTYQEAIKIWLEYYNKSLCFNEEDIKSIELIKDWVIVEE